MFHQIQLMTGKTFQQIPFVVRKTFHKYISAIHEYKRDITNTANI